ncbi:MAG: hypothetical protein DI533_01310 [Cereibacter sphaeroides]|uniref:LssY-like C-terminal domain-containing protein n=1 Tax=Cereibacter sphaeroides TaxID=1063 RepID=A0A2W5SHV6_CERSP|nr:MAG: hypothetical protein DI533_01310 [Cereibacter sphaeroides]
MQNNRRKLRTALAVSISVIAVYLLVAYLALPAVWYHREHQPGLGEKEAVTETSQGIPGDPLNVGLVGSEDDVLSALHFAGWYPADAITLRSSLRIAESVMLDRPDVQAPVSTLLYEGRKQDLAFEQPIGNSADRRNHVRFWKVLDKGSEGRPVWLGSATQDSGVELSRDTGQITHHIAPDIDDERNRLIDNLTTAQVVEQLYQVSGVGPTVAGRNGGGDPYYTDGEIRVAVLSPLGTKADGPPQVLADPPLVAVKDQLWAAVTGIVAPADPQ